MSPPKVSICIVTYNQKGYIRQCLESALAEAADVPVEILVGDDCSDDGTSDIVASIAAAHPSLVRHIRHEMRLNTTENSNAIVRLATGEFIAHIDGDDYWLRGKLKKQVEYLDRNPGCAAIYTNAITINENGSIIGVFNNVGEKQFDLAAMVRRGNFLNMSSILVRAQLRRENLEIDGPFLDYRAHLRYARTGYLMHIGKPLAAYRVASAGSAMSTARDGIRQLYWDAILEVPRELISDDDLARGMADFLRRVLARAIKTRRWSLLREWAPRVYAAAPCGRLRMAIWVGASAIRASAVMGLGKLVELTLNRPPVLYRR